jgi:hypothetical protein
MIKCSEGGAVLTVHEPAAVRGDVGLGDDEVEVCEQLHHLQQHAIPVHAIDLEHHTSTQHQ